MANNYDTYESLDFAQDDSFIRWVKGEDEAARQFWEAWRSGHPDKVGELEVARRLVLALRMKEEEPSAGRIDALWQRIDQATPRQARRIPLRRILPYAVAACVGLLLFFVLFNPSQNIYSGEQQLLHRLPDGSSVNLNAASGLSYRSRGWQKERAVELNGEAFFSVTKGSPFTVVTPHGQVQVLGTSFNIKATGAEFEVNCLSGRVAVSYGNSRQILNARQSTRLQADGVLSVPQEVPRPEIAEWRNVEIIMDSAKLREVFNELERQFGITVVSRMADDQRLVNAFFKNSNLDSALYNIDYSVNKITIQQRGDTVIVSDREE